MLGGLLALALAAPVAAQLPAAAWQPWFDAGQLPRFSGAVERFLPAPGGGSDSLLFREGAQVIFPPDLAPALREAAPEGRLLVVYGIRARSAPVITMLAWATSETEEPRWVERPAWPRHAFGRPRAERLAAAGTVRTPLFAANGEINGALLEDGTVIRLAPAAAATQPDRFKRGARIAAEGPGTEGSGTRALIAERLGEAPDSLADTNPPG
jgi:hypothetical protein